MDTFDSAPTIRAVKASRPRTVRPATHGRGARWTRSLAFRIIRDASDSLESAREQLRVLAAVLGPMDAEGGAAGIMAESLDDMVRRLGEWRSFRSNTSLGADDIPA